MGSRSRICDSTSVSKACSRKRSCMHSVHPVAISVSTKVWIKLRLPADRCERPSRLRMGKQIGKALKGHNGVVNAVALGEIDGAPVIVSGS